MSKLHSRLAQTWLNIQGSLFPWIAEALGELTQKQQELITTLELIRIEEFILSSSGYPGRPPKDRGAVARAFVAKAVYNMPTTRTLLDRLKTDIALRRICGWERVSDIPEEWTFSRAFAEFSESQLSERVHESFIKKHYKDEIVGHNSRDSTAINAREKPLKKEKVTQEPKKRGRPRKGEVRIKEPTRIDRRAILPHEILGTPVTKYSLTYGANWISPSTPCVRFNFAQKPLR